MQGSRQGGPASVLRWGWCRGFVVGVSSGYTPFVKIVWAWEVSVQLDDGKPEVEGPGT